MKLRLAAVTGLLLAACSTAGAPTPLTPGTTGAPPPTATAARPTEPVVQPSLTPAGSVVPASDTPGSATRDVALLPDPDAAATLGDTVTVRGGVDDQALLLVLEAVRMAERDPSGNPQYAFLVEIEGLDDSSLHYNTLHFKLFDDQSFAYDAYADGGRRPELTFGDLVPGRKVKGWVTFLGPEDSDYLELEYSPITALEPAYVRVLMP